MAEISVLAEGYVASLEGGRLRASPSAVLIEDARNRVLVDPGADERGLLSGLSRKGLSSEDVDLIFVTHSHLDHILNLRLFPETDVCDSGFIYRGDEEIPYGKFVPGTEIEVLPTPRSHPGSRVPSGSGRRQNLACGRRPILVARRCRPEDRLSLIHI